jgi:hypothetical protein
MRPRIDLDAGAWFVMAWIAVAFGTLPVLTLPLLLGTGPFTGPAFLVAQGLWTAVVYAVAGALLVRARPWRRLLDLVVTLFLLTVSAAALMGILRFIVTPGLWWPVADAVVPAATFGLVQIESFVPLKLGTPDVWQYVGLALGFYLGRLALTRAGRPVGAAAAPRITPWPLKSEHAESDAIEEGQPHRWSR